MQSENREFRSNSDMAGLTNQHQDINKESRFKQTAASQQLKKKMINRIADGKMQQSVKDQNTSSQMITSQNNQMRSQISKQQKMEDGDKQMATTEMNNNENEIKRKGIFEEYQERWNKNNKKIFRYLITWKVGDDGKIEDQLKLMITYLSIIFIIILVICGFATTYYFHQTNKENIKFSIENQAKTILENGLSQYQNSTEYIFKGYEFVLNYLNDIILSKLEISYKIYNFNEIRQFPYKGPNRMHKKDEDSSICEVYKGKVQFDVIDVSMKCIDWFEFDLSTKPSPADNEFVYQKDIPTEKLKQSIDILNYILESQMFDVFVTKIIKIYFGFEVRQSLFMFPGLLLNGTPSNYKVHERNWYKNTKQHHLNQQGNSTYRVISTPYYDAGSKTRVVTISKAILAPSPEDPTKRYLKGKGLFMGVASVDIKLNEFQELFQDITFYETGYLAIVSNQGKLLNEPAEFIKQINMESQTFEDLSITQLIDDTLWQQIKSSEAQLLQQTTSIQGLDIVIASSVNKDNFYAGESISEVYGAIDKQNSENLKRILLSSLISFAGFLLATVVCTIYVKKKIIQMVSAITELNQSALKLSGQNNDSSTHSKKEVMQKLLEIQQKAESETIKELVKGFENQLKGISKLGKGGQNILKNGKNVLKYDSAEYCGTNLLSYIDPLLSYLDSKKEKMDTDSVNYKPINPLTVNQLPVKTLSSHQKKQQNLNNSDAEKNNSLFEKKQQIPPLQAEIQNQSNGDILLQLQNSHDQTVTSPFSGTSGGKTTIVQNKLHNSKQNPPHQPIQLNQNAKIEGDNVLEEIRNFSDTDIDVNDADDIDYQY